MAEENRSNDHGREGRGGAADADRKSAHSAEETAEAKKKRVDEEERAAQR